MFQRAQLKFQAKKVLSFKYWPFFFISLLQYAVLGITSLRVNFPTAMGLQNIGFVLTTLGAAGLLALFVNIFLINPFKVGFNRFLIVNSEQEQTDYSSLLDIFRENYLDIVKASFIRDIFLLLWGLPYIFGVVIMSVFANLLSYWLALDIISAIFIIVGAIISILGFFLLMYKTYSYYMVNYILAENPTLSAKDAIAQSKELMQGVKFFTLTLELSFIGWYLLGAMLCGIGVFFVNPYQNATITQLYLTLRNNKDFKDRGYTIID